jgi:hypothetical protein
MQPPLTVTPGGADYVIAVKPVRSPADHCKVQYSTAHPYPMSHAHGIGLPDLTESHVPAIAGGPRQSTGQNRAMQSLWHAPLRAPSSKIVTTPNQRQRRKSDSPPRQTRRRENQPTSRPRTSPRSAESLSTRPTANGTPARFACERILSISELSFESDGQSNTTQCASDDSVVLSLAVEDATTGSMFRTYVPRPCSRLMRPSCSSSAKARRTVPRLTQCTRASSRSVGNFAPTGIPPDRHCRTNHRLTRAYRHPVSRA